MLLHKHSSHRIIVVTSVSLVAALASIWFARQYRQARLSHTLIDAIKHADADKVDALLAEGADPNTRDTPDEPFFRRIWDRFQPPPWCFSRPALSVTLGPGRQFPGTQRIVKALIAAGSDVNATDKFGETALMSAAFNSDLDDVRTLMEAHAEVNAKTKRGMTALMSAALVPQRNADVVYALIIGRADVNAKDNTGWTLLMYATAGSNARCMKALMAAGADVNARGKKGKTVLMLAESSNQTEIAAILRKARAKK